jgi:hypothetical protein
MSAVVEVKSKRTPAKRAPKPVSMLEVIERASRDPAVDVDKLERLLAMAERVRAAEREAEFAAAMNAVQSELRKVFARAENDSTGSRYATFEDLDGEARPIYTKHGFSLQFNTADPPPSDVPMVRVTCDVVHRGGHKVHFMIDMPADGKGAKGGNVMTRTHATASAIQYGRRYLLRMIFNVVTTENDDDGNAAGSTPISENQAADLRALATEIGVNIPAYLKAIRADSFESIPATRFKDALATLEAKRRRQT